MKPIILAALFGLLCLPVTTATTIPFEPPTNWAVQDVQGATYNNGNLTKETHGYAWVNLSKGNESMLLAVYFPSEPPISEEPANYTDTLNQLLAAVQTLPHPVNYTDTLAELRGLLVQVLANQVTIQTEQGAHAENHQANSDESRERDGVLATEIKGIQPKTHALLYVLQATTLIAVAYLVIKPNLRLLQRQPPPVRAEETAPTTQPHPAPVIDHGDTLE